MKVLGSWSSRRVWLWQRVAPLQCRVRKLNGLPVNHPAIHRGKPSSVTKEKHTRNTKMGKSELLPSPASHSSSYFCLACLVSLETLLVSSLLSQQRCLALTFPRGSPQPGGGLQGQIHAWQHQNPLPTAVGHCSPPCGCSVGTNPAPVSL